MKHFLLVLGLAIIPTKQENLQPLSPLAPPYIHTTIPPQPLLQPPTMALVDALILVESCGNPNAYCKREEAVGCLQIRPIMLREVNRILRKQGLKRRFSLEDRWNCGSSKEIFYIWKRWHHKNSSEEKIARCWNGGPRGWKKKATQKYWAKVKIIWEE